MSGAGDEQRVQPKYSCAFSVQPFVVLSSFWHDGTRHSSDKFCWMFLMVMVLMVSPWGRGGIRVHNKSCWDEVIDAALITQFEREADVIMVTLWDKCKQQPSGHCMRKSPEEEIGQLIWVKLLCYFVMHLIILWWFIGTNYVHWMFSTRTLHNVQRHYFFNGRYECSKWMCGI